MFARKGEMTVSQAGVDVRFVPVPGPGAQLGDTTEMLDQARVGANVGTVTDVARLSSFVPSLAIMSAPFLFDTYEQADTFALSPDYLAWGDELKAKSGLMMLASNWYQGPRHLLTKKPVSGPADLAGVRMRTIGAPIWIETIRAMGAEPTPMAWGEVYPALETRAIDGQENPVVTIDTSKLYEVQKYLSLTRHAYTPFLVLYSQRLWDQLTADEQKALRACAVVGRDEQRRVSRELTSKSLERVKAAGMEVSEISPAEIAKLRESTRPVYERHRAAIGADTMERLEAALKSLRGN